MQHASAHRTDDLTALLLSEEWRREERVQELKREAEALRARIASLEAQHAEDRKEWRAQARTQEGKIAQLFQERNTASGEAATARETRDRLLAQEDARVVITRRLIVAVREGEDVEVETHTRALAKHFRLPYT